MLWPLVLKTDYKRFLNQEYRVCFLLILLHFESILNYYSYKLGFYIIKYTQTKLLITY